MKHEKNSPMKSIAALADSTLFGMGEPPPTITTPSRELPQGWVDRLFSRMTELYGQKWLDYLGLAGGLEAASKAWSLGLSGLSADELRRGLDLCLTRNNPWPPTLPEFRGLCRPQRDAEAEFRRAAHIIGKQPIDWRGDAVLYHAALTVGCWEIRTQPYVGTLKARWEKALRDFESRLDLMPPPSPPKALIEEKPTPRNKAIDILAGLKARFYGAGQP